MELWKKDLRIISFCSLDWTVFLSVVLPTNATRKYRVIENGAQRSAVEYALELW